MYHKSKDSYSGNMGVIRINVIIGQLGLPNEGISEKFRGTMVEIYG